MPKKLRKSQIHRIVSSVIRKAGAKRKLDEIPTACDTIVISVYDKERDFVDTIGLGGDEYDFQNICNRAYTKWTSEVIKGEIRRSE